MLEKYVTCNIIFPPITMIPRTKKVRKGLNESEIITKPQDGFEEHVFLRDAKADADGFVTIKLKTRDWKSVYRLNMKKRISQSDPMGIHEKRRLCTGN